MINLEILLGPSTVLPGTSLPIKIDRKGVTVSLPGGREQYIGIEQRGDHLLLTSVILGSDRANDQGEVRLAHRVWQMNRDVDVVAFGKDEHGRLVGRIEHPSATMHQEETLFYIAVLARECDRAEHMLAGCDLS